MSYPPLVAYASVDEYRVHFEQVYCQRPVITFDAIPVRFRKNDFDHAFFESSHRDGVKDTFSVLRSERIDWIKHTLQDPSSDLYVGWDGKRKRHDRSRRVAVVQENYVVVVRLNRGAEESFIGSFVTLGSLIFRVVGVNDAR